METKNPRAGSDAEASLSIRTDTEASIRNRPKLQANRQMRVRLGTLLLARKWGLDHG